MSTDRRLCVWAPGADEAVLVQDLAHPQPFSGVGWASEDVLWTAGTDGVIVRKALKI